MFDDRYTTDLRLIRHSILNGGSTRMNTILFSDGFHITACFFVFDHNSMRCCCAVFLDSLKHPLIPCAVHSTSICDKVQLR